MIARTTRDGATITVEIAADEATLVSDLNIVGRGQARCKPDDVFVFATGERIALGRALQDFGRQVEEAGASESVSCEDVERVFNAIFLAAFG